MGKTPSRNCKNYWDNGIYNWVSIADIGKTTKYIYETKEKITENAVLESGIKLVPKGTIIMSFKLSLGKTCITGKDIYTNEAIMAFLDKHIYSIDKNYIYHLFSNYNWEQNTNKAVKGITLNKATLSKIKIPLPPLEEQHKIASILDTVSETLKLRKQQLNELDLLVKSKFIDMFGDPIENPMKWEHITLNDICDIGSSKRIYESEYVSNGIPFYRTKEIVELSKGNSISTELFISIKRFNEIKSKYSVPKKNDILISAVGTIGTIWVVDGKEDFYFKDGNLLLIKASNKFSPIYMSFLLENLIGYYKKGLSSGTAYCALTIEKLKCMKAFNPPIELQNKFASFVQHIDELKSEAQKSIDQLQTLFDSLMQQYF